MTSRQTDTDHIDYKLRWLARSRAERLLHHLTLQYLAAECRCWQGWHVDKQNISDQLKALNTGNLACKNVLWKPRFTPVWGTGQSPQNFSVLRHTCFSFVNKLFLNRIYKNYAQHMWHQFNKTYYSRTLTYPTPEARPGSGRSPINRKIVTQTASAACTTYIQICDCCSWVNRHTVHRIKISAAEMPLRSSLLLYRYKYRRM